MFVKTGCIAKCLYTCVNGTENTKGVDLWSVFLNIALNTGSNSRSSAAVQRGLTLGPGSPTPRSPGSPGSPERP